MLRINSDLNLTLHLHVYVANLQWLYASSAAHFVHLIKKVFNCDVILIMLYCCV
jgi:hypothetical protein